MSHSVMDLASNLLVAAARFKRQAQRGMAPTGQDLRDELVQTIRGLGQQAGGDARSKEAWDAALNPLIFLIDEVMINTEWEYRGWWADNDLETELLGHPRRMSGILFYDELEQAVKRFESSGRGPDQDHHAAVLTVFYCALRFGFEGKFVGQTSELKREAQQLLAKLPAANIRAVREYFPQAYEHTVEVQPNYQAYMRLATVLGVAVGLIVLFIGLRQVVSAQVLGSLTEAAEQLGTYFTPDA